MTYSKTENPVLNYQEPLPRTSRMALILFIVSIPAAMGFFLVVPPLVVWLLALVACSWMTRRQDFVGFRRARIAAHVSGWSFLVGLLMLVFMPSMGGNHRLSNRSVCAANLRGTCQSMNVYAADNADAYPIVSPTGGYALASGGNGRTMKTAEDTILSMYTAPAASVTQNMWLLVLTRQVAPKQFFCKDDPSPAVNASVTNGGKYQINFNDGKGRPSDFSYSYSFAYPWESTPKAPVGAWLKNFTDASLPLMADLAPFDGTGTPAATPGNPRSNNANSFSHNRDGQNVGYGDAHAEFARHPTVGQLNDNIYTYSGGIPSETGTPPRAMAPGVGDGGKPGAFDICMVPAVDGKTWARR